MATDHEVNPNEVDPPKRKRGRPKKVKDPIREPLREAMREDASFVYRPDDDGDRLYIHPSHIPDGQDYQWITSTIYGQPQTQRLARFQRQGWTPVPASRHDGMFMPRGYQGYIEVDGLMLHERSKKISDMAKLHELKKARGQIRAKEVQLLGGDVGTTLDSQHPTALRSNRINKSYEKIPIPED